MGRDYYTSNRRKQPRAPQTYGLGGLLLRVILAPIKGMLCAGFVILLGAAVIYLIRAFVTGDYSLNF